MSGSADGRVDMCFSVFNLSTCTFPLSALWKTSFDLPGKQVSDCTKCTKQCPLLLSFEATIHKVGCTHLPPLTILFAICFPEATFYVTHRYFVVIDNKLRFILDPRLHPSDRKHRSTNSCATPLHGKTKMATHL
ncbi:hypothetical protein PoB_002047700 [Plakobranchus ocellatus]|uniref:Uncharacterized protein n=1 Tax=Plakobranchus ocellatus TaxID=259542 RepID=A0AAV3ZHJ0_9GAST|nr:hypothetical protein PoB_002047700 [Plakobranchus ocellatus]